MTSAKRGKYTVVCPILVEDFTNVGAISLVLKYPATARFTGYKNVNQQLTHRDELIIGSFGERAKANQVTIGWYDAQVPPLPVFISGKLCDLKFEVDGGTAFNLEWVKSENEVSSDVPAAPAIDVGYS